MGVAVNSPHIVSTAPSSSHSSPAPGWGPSHRTQLSRNLSNVGHSYRLRYSQTTPAWVPSMGCSPSGTGCSSVGRPLSHKSCQKTCSSMGSSLSTGPHVLAGTCSSAGSPRGHSFLWASTCSSVESSIDYRWISTTLWTSVFCRGTACLTMVCTMGCRGICSSAWSISSPFLLH